VSIINRDDVKTIFLHFPYGMVERSIGRQSFPARTPNPNQWFRQKLGGDSAVRSEFVIAGMIFHPSRVKS
jgi:hypothetical protein